MTRNPKKICSRIGLAMLVMMLVWLCGAMVLSILCGLFLPGFVESDWGIWLLNDLPLYGLALPVFLLVMYFIPDGSEPQRETKKMTVGQFLLVFLVGLGSMYLFSFLTTFLVSLLELVSGIQYVDGLQELGNTGGMLQILLLGAALPALGEEYIFRYMLRRKMKGCGDAFYVVFSALCFSLFHGNPSQLLYTFTIGVLLAAVYVRTGSIWYAVALHFLFNVFGMAIIPGLITLGDVAAVVVVLVLLGLIVVTIVVVALYAKRVVAQFYPPSEPGWPYKPPRQNPWQQPPQTFDRYAQQPGGYGAPAQGYGYGYAAQAPLGQPYQNPPYAGPAAGQAPVPPYGGAGNGQNPYEARWPDWQRQAYGNRSQPHPGYGGYPSQGAYPQPRPQPWQNAPAQRPPLSGGAYGYPYQTQAPQAGQGVPPTAYPQAPPAAYGQYGQAPYPPMAPAKRPSFLGVGLGNVGMILYLCLSGIMTLITLFA
ncbi:CPBP family intramembrane metalloprotease [Ruminococcaceae bacterium OttesenSCG-928-I18]|nr:CPBP family intramembrane metalloprotease [Ruminococcaceae bacterium OttesenSCG-928-I18]